MYKPSRETLGLSSVSQKKNLSYFKYRIVILIILSHVEAPVWDINSFTPCDSATTLKKVCGQGLKSIMPVILLRDVLIQEVPPTLPQALFARPAMH
mmetsp:Transcript_145333/g.264100  ORF Transcript_145333/g.264100 Transcript_145333/m.264100 type:complete len:96 (-) Transcript_145333:294-581(-)